MRPTSRQPITVTRRTWARFLSAFDWRQGEHVTLIGPTGCGKSTLAKAILPIRDHRIVVATKPRDPLLQTFNAKDGYFLTRDWPIRERRNAYCVWPKITRPSDRAVQKDTVARVLDDVFIRGGYCLYLDELRYVTKDLRLSEPVEMLYQQGRAMGVSLVGCIVRPRHVPLLAYDQATHLFLWGNTDESNVNRLSELGARNRRAILGILPRLGKHDVLYVNTRNGELSVTNTATGRG